MRIIKNIGGVFQIVAGEMLNIESSLLHFIDGKPTKPGVDIPIDQYNGYPRLVDGQMVNIIRSASGYIFVPPGCDLDIYEQQLNDQLIMLEATMVRADGKDIANLRQYHTVRSGYNTNIKVKSSQRITQLHSGKIAKTAQHKRDAANTVRQYIRSTDDSRRGRFTWIIQHIDKFNFEISSNDIEDAVSRFACSIFVDLEDICKLGHNDITHQFSINHLKGSDKIIQESITLFKHGHPLLIELSEHWRDNFPGENASEFLRNVPRSKVFSTNEVIPLNPVKLNSEGETSTNVCSKCRSLLWGENYALAVNIQNPQQNICTAVCPLCLHSSPRDKPIEMKYLRIYRFNFPRTVDEMLLCPLITDQRRDLLKEALGGFESKIMQTISGDIPYTLIGSKYAAFTNQKDYLFTKLSTDPEFIGRTICTARVVQ